MMTNPDPAARTGTSIWRRLELRNELPAQLRYDFMVFKDKKSIDRIQVAAWIGVSLTLCLFGLDYFRYKEGGFADPDQAAYLKAFFYWHLSGILFLVPALHTTFHKNWIKETRWRRGIVIWGMVALTFFSSWASRSWSICIGAA